MTNPVIFRTNQDIFKIIKVIFRTNTVISKVMRF